MIDFNVKNLLTIIKKKIDTKLIIF